MARATQSNPFATVAGQIKTRVGAKGFFANPNAQGNEGVYLAGLLTGVYLQFEPPDPSLTPGGGGYNTPVVRPFRVWVVTQSLHDTLGMDDMALAVHWEAEDGVVNTLADKAAHTTKIGVGRGVFWLPGGDEIRRRIKTDPSMIVSVLRYGVEYQAYIETGV